jgi:hypothetical protein
MSRAWTDSELAELSNLYHLARTALSGSGRDTPYHRRLWASNEYAKIHPGVSETAAYKQLDREAAWMQEHAPRRSRTRSRR